MSSNSDNMVITPRFLASRDSGPRRRAKEARNLEGAKRKRATIMQRLRKAKVARRLQSARAAKTSAGIRKAAGAGGKLVKAGSRLMGPIGIALLVMDAVNVAGSTVRRAEGGVSGRLLEAMDQDGIYGRMDEIATGAEQGRKNIEGNEDLLRIIGIEGRVNSQIGQLGAWFRERETARAIGSDLIEREPSFDHLGSIADKAIQGGTAALKSSTDSAINAIRGFLGKGELTR